MRESRSYGSVRGARSNTRPYRDLKLEMGSQMTIWERHALLAALLGASFLTPFTADATKVKIVSGLVGGQDSKSKELLALSPGAADQVARRDLLSLLHSTGKFTLDNSRNVDGMTFITEPYPTEYRYVCREDRVTLRYHSDNQRQPMGVDAQPAYHIEQLPVPGFMPGTSYRATVCDARHPDAAAAWFAARSDTDAVRAANMFRMAEDEVKARRLTPGPCDPHGADTCRQWILSLDDPSKIESVEPCAPTTGNDACYVISFDSIDVTVTGTIPSNTSEPITPTAITSIRVDTVETLLE